MRNEDLGLEVVVPGTKRGKQPDTSLFSICSDAHATDPNFPIGKFPIAHAICRRSELEQDLNQYFVSFFILDHASLDVAIWSSVWLLFVRVEKDCGTHATVRAAS